MNNGTLGHRESDKPGLSEHTGVLDREAPTSKRQRRWWEYVTAAGNAVTDEGISAAFAEYKAKRSVSRMGRNQGRQVYALSC